MAARRRDGWICSGAALAATLAAAASLASCAGDDDRDEIETAVRDVQRAFAAGNTERVCRLLTRDGRRQIEGIGHDVGPGAAAARQPCYVELYVVLDGVRKLSGWRSRTAREIADVRVDGDRATASVEFEDGSSASLPLAREDGEWKVDALYGGVPAAQQEDHY